MLTSTVWCVALFLAVNTLFAIVTVFTEDRDIAAIWAWLMVLTLLPGLGFAIYFVVGCRLSNKKIFRLRTQEQRGLEQVADNQRQLLQEVGTRLPLSKLASELMTLFLASGESVVTRGNDVMFFHDGQTKFAALFADIAKAKHHIHLEYFTIAHDGLGQQLFELLTQKAREGVAVRVIYDQFGSHGRHPKLYRALRQVGGQVVPFLMRRLQVLTWRVNFRNHRKIAIIDGMIGYIGGINVADQYVSRSTKFGHWRDTHTRVIGDAVLTLQSVFLMDWNATAEARERLDNTEAYFPAQQQSYGADFAQIVTSGPDQTNEQIKQGFLRMFASAQRRIIIQTPYFIPDAPILETLKMALLSGITVDLMIPNQPDHVLVYRATEYYARELVMLGAAVYRYDDGFLHSKVVIVDDEVATVGSANMDIRSFALNFEANIYIYNPATVAELTAQFTRDVAVATRLTRVYFDSQSWWMGIKQRFSRLFSPIL